MGSPEAVTIQTPLPIWAGCEASSAVSGLSTIALRLLPRSQTLHLKPLARPKLGRGSEQLLVCWILH